MLLSVMIIKQIVKVIQFLHTFTIMVMIAYKLPGNMGMKKNVWMKAGFIIILSGGILDLTVACTGYDNIILHPSVLIYLGSTLLTFGLIGVIRSLFIHTHKDSLTGTYNKRALYHSIDRHIRTGHGKNPFAIIFMDIDNFKAINDNFGHLTADSMLKDVCTNIRKKIRKVDLLFRYGGDEFVLLIPGSNKIETGQLMSRLASDLDQESKVLMRFSYGIACYPEDGNNAEVLLNKADQQIYYKKSLTYSHEFTSSG